MDDTRFLSINLNRLMMAHGLSQKKLADATKVSEHTIFRAVSKGTIPRGSNLNKIANFFGVSVADLYMDPSKGVRTSQAETSPAQNLTPETVKAIKQAVSEAIASKPEHKEVTPKDGIEYVKSLIDGLSYDDKITLANYATGSALGDADLAEPAIQKRKLRR